MIFDFVVTSPIRIGLVYQGDVCNTFFFTLLSDKPIASITAIKLLQEVFLLDCIFYEPGCLHSVVTSLIISC